MRWVFRNLGQQQQSTTAGVEAGRPSPGGRFAARNIVTLTTGLFRVPQAPNLSLNVYAANMTDQTSSVTLQVNRVAGTAPNQSKETVASRAFTLPGLNAAELSLTAPAGDVVEVNAIIPTSEVTAGLRVAPSAAVVQFFPADGGITPQIVRAAGSFTAVQRSGRSLPATLPTVRSGTLTTGLLDMSQGVAAARPQAEVLFSNFADESLEARVIVRELVEHLPTLQPLAEHTVNVPAGGAAILALESVEGRVVKVDVDSPSDQLVVSMAAYTFFLADDSTAPTFDLGPQDWAVINFALRTNRLE